MEEASLEGWSPEPRTPDDVAQVVDFAFDYRGDVTLVMRDGSERVGYVCNRYPNAAEPFVELLEPSGGGPVRVRYTELRTIRFTGRDMASGKSYTAWLERKRTGKARDAR
jgi:hypothetical protein